MAAAGDDASLSDQVGDARRHLRRLGSPVASAQPRSSGAGVAVGVGLAAGGGVLAGLSGWQASEVQRLQAAFQSAELDWDARVTEYAEPGEQAATASNALLGGAVGLGVGGVAAAVVSLLARPRGQASTSPSVQFALVPDPAGGGRLIVAGRW